MLIRFIKVVLAITCCTIVPYFIGGFGPLHAISVPDRWIAGIVCLSFTFLLVMLIRSIYMYIVYDGK